MMIKEFTARVAEDVLHYLPEEARREIEVVPTEVIKLNDRHLHGISFQKGKEPAPTYYLDDMFGRFLLGEETEDLLQELADEYMYRSSQTFVPEELADMDFRNVREKAGVRLLGKDYNRDFLQTVPFRDVGNGYVLVCDIQVKAPDGSFFSTVVTNSLAEGYDYDMEALFDAALDHAWRENAASLRAASELMYSGGMQSDNRLARVDGSGEVKEESYVLTTDRQQYGAAAMFYPGTQAMIAHVLKEDYYAIPSSLHEFIIVRASSVEDAQHLQQLVLTANRTFVGQDDVLSDNLLVYKRRSRELTLAVPADNGLVLNGGHTV